MNDNRPHVNSKRTITMDTPPLATASSPRSVVVTTPPTKRQKQVTEPKRLGFFPDASSDNPTAGSILDYIRDDALMAHIFSFVGPKGTACCARVCPTWHAASYSHPSLWRTFLSTDFGCTLTTPQQQACHIYSLLAHRHQTTQAEHLPASVIFADDGGNFPGYPAQHALLASKTMVWCTSTGADQNVDLVLELDQPCLLTGFVAANGGRGYSAPLKEGLVFVSMDPPNLESSRCYNHVETNSNNGLGSAWVQHLFQPATSQPIVAAVLEEEEAFLEAVNDNINNNEQAGNEGNNEQDPNNNHNEPRQRHAELERPDNECPSTTTTTPPSTPPDAPHPVAAFSFPDLVTAYHGDSEQTLTKPLVGRFLHFKLLSSHSPPGLEHISDNIDLMNFHPMGVPVPELEQWMVKDNEDKDNDDVVVPDYQRQHEVRQSRINNPLDLDEPQLLQHPGGRGGAGPWFHLDFF